MEFHVTNRNYIFCNGMAMLTLVPDIHELMSFEYINFNELVLTDPLLSKKYEIEIHET